MNVWRTLHPKTSVVPTLGPEMRFPFYWCMAAFLLLYLALLQARVRLAEQEDRLDLLLADAEG